MLAGTFYYVIVFTMGASRVEAVERTEETDPPIRVALVYGSSVTVDFLTVAEYGFSLGFTDGESTYTEVLTTALTTLNVALDRNLKRDGTGHYVTASGASDTEIGAYHIRLTSTKEGSEALLAAARAAYPSYDVFPAYLNGTYCVMLGHYATESKAVGALDALKKDPASASEPLTSALSGASVSKPSATAVTVLDSSSNTVVWEFDCADGSAFMAAKALQPGSTYSYIMGYRNGTKYTYDGVLECSPYETDEAYGVKVINILPLETYVAGVIPYEIGNAWPLETQKAFAIAVRSYAISNLGRHKKSYNADLCGSSDCQVYKGFGSTNALVRQAVTETKGKIAVYNGTGDICITAYSSSTGGCTANAWDVWGSSQKTYGYLKAVATPWEKYEQYGKGSWTFTATGKQLYERLKAKGYTALKGAVTKIEITGLGENSTYVTAIKFYDGNGNSVEVTQGNKVKSLLSSYVNSGNFVVAKAGDTVTRTNFTMTGFGSGAVESSMGVVVKTNPFDHSLYGRQTFSVLTAGGTKTFTDTNGEFVMTGNGVMSYDMSHALDATFYPTVSGVNGETLPDIGKLKAVAELETLTANGPEGSFVFIGRGWGHGVGLSQWGIKDLGDLGYDYETIFKAYYSDIRIVDFQAYLNGTA